MSTERTCLFCGKQYSYCPNCRDYSKYPGWMNLYCSEKCHEVHTAIGGYNIGSRSIENVKEILNKYNVTDCPKISKDLKEQLESFNSFKQDKPEETLKVESKVNKEETEVKKSDSDEKKINSGFNTHKMKKNNFERRGSSKE